jgi:sugar lactone lactonase YvrE
VDGKFLLDFAIPAADAFNGPHLQIAPDGSVLVSAPQQNKLQRFSRDGKLLGEWGGLGQALGQLSLPTGIRIAGSNLWIADTANYRIQQWEIH